ENQSTSPAVSLLVNNAEIATTTFFGVATTAPTQFNVDSSVELGVKFRSDVSGFITGIRFYKGSADTSVHTGTLWSATGGVLARGTFSVETASGWQQLNFSTPVPIAADTTYVASYHTSGGFFYTTKFFESQGVD